ncbi:helix-turn-helix transcriptional regulator [Pantoea cypripedii]|uniref:AlpA family transcriptional regulator n=1 Tax=Pantoea cypripedii TaxID=55209 RepID=A0A6B9G8A5_PANCY|nr:AlpA family transcriptional regulator [Pantoea cypripedii]QGY29039.1 AlpA family transcriptional regulator [Pantoea cypripedii]
MADIEMITEKEAMQKIQVTSRTTMRNYVNHYAFPKPVTNRPKKYLLAEVEKWILNGGVNQR